MTRSNSRLGLAAVLSAALLATVALGAGAGATPVSPPAVAKTEQLHLTILERHPHDRRAFTQGLLLHGSTLYESTGLYGQSSLRQVDLASGIVQRQVALPPNLFGEGLALVGDRLFQLTWTNGVARVYSRDRLTLVGEHRYEGEGWGLCYDGESLVMSNGSDRLVLRDPETFAVRKTLRVYDDAGPVAKLNELECVGHHVYANVWGSWRIVRIDGRSGRVDGEIDADKLLSAMEKAALPNEAVLNGIAYDPATETFLLTGKLWPRIHRVRIATSGAE
jgi:glutamine cyclotransferase